MSAPVACDREMRVAMQRICSQHRFALRSDTTRSKNIIDLVPKPPGAVFNAKIPRARNFPSVYEGIYVSDATLGRHKSFLKAKFTCLSG